MNARHLIATHPRQTASLLLFAVMAAATTSGVLLDRAFIAPGFAEARQGAFGIGVPFGRAPGTAPGRVFGPSNSEALARELGLTVEQRKRIDALLERQTGELKALREEMRPRMDSLLRGFRKQLDSLLTPEQRRRLEVLRANRRGSHPPPGST